MKQPARDDEVIPTSTRPLSIHSYDASRAFAYVSLGALSTLLPLPWLPDVTARRVRGTMLHDLASRHQLSLSDAARDELLSARFFGVPGGDGKTRFVVSQLSRFVTRRLLAWLGPLSWLPPARTALLTFILGHVFERYLETARTSRSVRIELEEAKQVRRSLERTLLRLITSKPDSPWRHRVRPPEDLRADSHKLIDGAILSLASLPGWFISQLDQAFDQAWGSTQNA